MCILGNHLRRAPLLTPARKNAPNAIRIGRMPSCLGGLDGTLLRRLIGGAAFISGLGSSRFSFWARARSSPISTVFAKKNWSLWPSKTPALCISGRELELKMDDFYDATKGYA